MFIPEKKAGKCPLCGNDMVKHIVKEGARYHVHRYSLCSDDFGKFSKIECSAVDCEDNHGYGLCVPRTQKYMDNLKKLRKEWKKEGFIKIVHTKENNASDGIPHQAFTKALRERNPFHFVQADSH